MSKGLIRALLHALYDRHKSVDIRNKHNIYRTKMQEHFFLEDAPLVWFSCGSI